jgi:DNA polymerase III subunit beta
MKFSALREDLLNAMQTVQYSANTKGMMPILSGIKIEVKEGEILLHATDLEAYTTTKCSANIEKIGVCVVNLKVVMDILRDSNDEKLDVEVTGNEMVLKGQKSLIKLFTMPAEDFPSPPEVNIPVIEALDKAIFLPAVQKVSRAASRDEKRPTLLGIYMEVEEKEINMVSTDSYRLSIRKIKEGFTRGEQAKYIIPASAMLNLARIAGKKGTMDVYRDENGGQVRFEMEGTSHTIRLIEGKFPKYGQFIPESLEQIAEVNREEIMGALKRASLISSTVKMKINADGITVSSESRDIGEGKENVSVVYTGDEIEIAFNSRFLEDGIQSIDGESVILGMSEPLKPGIIKEKDMEDFMYIIMPIRL